MRIVLWLSSVAVTICSGDLQHASPRFALSQEEITAAIEWGRSAQPEGYALRNSAGERVGALYTPYLRVALASRFAAELNQSLAPELSSRVIDPRGPDPGGDARVYIAMRVDGVEWPAAFWPALELRLLRDSSGGAAAANVIATSGSTTLGRGRRFAPAYLQYGLDLDAVYVVASFPRGQLQAAMQVELFNRSHGTRWREGAVGVITASDLSDWK